MCYRDAFTSVRVPIPLVLFEIMPASGRPAGRRVACLLFLSPPCHLPLTPSFLTHLDAGLYYAQRVCGNTYVTEYSLKTDRVHKALDDSGSEALSSAPKNKAG
jgi:hypothetical protein